MNDELDVEWLNTILLYFQAATMAWARRRDSRRLEAVTDADFPGSVTTRVWIEGVCMFGVVTTARKVKEFSTVNHAIEAHIKRLDKALNDHLLFTEKESAICQQRWSNLAAGVRKIVLIDDLAPADPACPHCGGSTKVKDATGEDYPCAACQWVKPAPAWKARTMNDEELAALNRKIAEDQAPQHVTRGDGSVELAGGGRVRSCLGSDLQGIIASERRNNEKSGKKIKP